MKMEVLIDEQTDKFDQNIEDRSDEMDEMTDEMDELDGRDVHLKKDMDELFRRTRWTDEFDE